MRGTITKYKVGGVVKSWGYYFRQRNDTGTWKQNTKSGFETKREAERALREALILAGLESESKPAEPEQAPTFNEVLEQFLSEADCTLGTLEAYRKQSRYPSREFGSRPVDTITTEDLQKLFQTLRTAGGDKGRPLSPKTLKHIRFLMKCVFDRAAKQNHLASSPLTKDVRTPKLRKKKFKMPEKHRLKEVILRARGRRLYPILEVTSATGARMSEILALQWSDYSAERGTLEISKALEDTKHGVRVKSTKSEEPRIVSLPSSVIAVLEEHRKRQEQDRAVMGSAYDDQGYIFCPPQGGFYRPSNISTRVSAFLHKQGLALSMHGLRHAHASILLSQGADIQSVSDRLGHADPSITLSIYSHVIPSDRGRLALLWDDDRKPRVVEMLANASSNSKKSA